MTDPRDVDALVRLPIEYARWLSSIEVDVRVHDLTSFETAALISALTDEAATTITALQAEVAALRKALRTYAGPLDDTWNEKPYPYWADGYPGGVFIADNVLDFGDTARAALGQQP